MFAGEKVAGRRNEWTKNCKNEKLTIRKKIQNKKMSGRKNVKTKKYTTKKKRGKKNHATKECGTKICGRKNLRRKLAGRKSVLTRNVSWIFFVGKASELCVFKYLAKNNCYPQISIVYFHWKWCRYCSWKLTVIFGSVRILANRVNCPCPEQGRNPNSLSFQSNFQVQYLIQFYP